MTESTERLWSEDELAERWHMSPLTLRKWRSLGAGPKSIKVGRNALYRDPEVARWESAQREG